MAQDLYDNDQQQQQQTATSDTSDTSGTGGHAIGMTEDNPQQLEEAVVMPEPKLEFPEEKPEKPEKPEIEPYGLPDGRNLVDYLEVEARKAKAAAPTPEELRREARHRRTSKIIAGIGDAASSIANLFATIHYAPSAKRPQKALGEHLQGVYDRIDASRKEQEKYLRGLQEKLATAKDALINGRYSRAKDALGEYHKDMADYNREMGNYNRQVGNVLKQRHDEKMEKIAEERLEEQKRHNGESEADADNRNAASWYKAKHPKKNSSGKQDTSSWATVYSGDRSTSAKVPNTPEAILAQKEKYRKIAEMQRNRKQ